MLIDKLPEDAEEVLNEVEFLRQKLMEDPSDDVCRKLIAAEDRLINRNSNQLYASWKSGHRLWCRFGFSMENHSTR